MLIFCLIFLRDMTYVGHPRVAHYTSLLEETPQHLPLSLVETDITSISQQSTTMSIGRTNCTKEQQGRRKRLALHSFGNPAFSNTPSVSPPTLDDMMERYVVQEAEATCLLQNGATRQERKRQFA